MNREAIQSLLSRLLAMGGSLLTMVLASRLLGPEGKGKYSYMLAVLGIGLQAGSLGWGTANLFYASRERQSIGLLAGNTMLVAGLSAGVLLAVLYSCTILFPRVVPFDAVTSLVLGGALFAGLVWAAAQNILVGSGLVGWFNLLSVAYSLFLAAAMAVVFARYGGMFLAIALAQFASNFIACLVIIAVIRGASPGGIGTHRELLGRTLAYGMSVYAAQAITFIAMRVDLLVVQYRLSASDLGLYSLASDFCSVIVQMQAVLNLLLFARLARTRTSEERLAATRSMLLTSGAILSVGLLVGSLVLERVVGIIFGPAFMPAAQAVLALMPGTLFLVLASVLQNHLGAAGRPALMAVGPAVAFATSVVLNPVLVERHGISGAAWSSTIAYLAMCIAAGGLVLRVERRRPLGS